MNLRAHVRASAAVVADMALDAVRQNRFLVLSHPHVADMQRQKLADYDGWIAGMRRYQHALREGT